MAFGWISAEAGEIRRTFNYRPYKAAKLMREEDSFFDIAVVPQLYTYPGDMNARIRYESMSSRPVQGTDLERAAAKAHRSYSEVFKKVKNQIKNPLSDKQPVMLLHAAALGVTENGQYVMTDGEGTRLLLEDIPSMPQGTVEPAAVPSGRRPRRLYSSGHVRA